MCGSRSSTRIHSFRRARLPSTSATRGSSPPSRPRSVSSRCSSGRTDQLSGGQAKRVALAHALVGEFDMIVLDEPTNHLDLEAIEWLEQRLAATKAALVVITHDRHLMDRLTTARGEGRIVEIERGAGYIHRAAAGRQRLRHLSRGARRSSRAGGQRGGDPQDPRPPRAGVAAARGAGPIDQAESAVAVGQRDRVRRSGGGGCARQRPVARRRFDPARQPGDRVGRGVAGVRPERGVPRRQPADRAGGAARSRRAERLGQVDAARHRGRAVAIRPAARSSAARPW